MARNRDGRRTTKKDEEAKRLRPEDLAFLGDAARKQIEEQLATSEKATEAKPQDEVLSVDQSRKTVKRVKASDLGRMTLKEIAKSLGYGSVGGVSKLLEALISGSPVGSQVGITREVKQQQASLMNMAEQVNSNTKLLAMMGDEQKRTTELLAVLLDEIRKLNGQGGQSSGGGPNITPVPLPSGGQQQKPGQAPQQIQPKTRGGGFFGRILGATALGAAAGGVAAVGENMLSGSSGSASTPGMQPPPGSQPGGSDATRSQQPPQAIPGSGNFIRPVSGPITSPFGQRSRGNHEGIDFGVPEGTPVLAAQSGTVIKAYTSRSYGNVIYIMGDDGTETRYAHLSVMSVQEGNRINQGQVIGLSGNTGISTGPHLHFEVRKDGRPVDPTQMIGVTQETATAGREPGQQNADMTAENVNQLAPAQAAMVETPSTSGTAVAAASASQKLSETQPITVSVGDSTADTGLDNPSQGSFDYQVDTGDPGPVEPDDARERYEKLFAEAA